MTKKLPKNSSLPLRLSLAAALILPYLATSASTFAAERDEAQAPAKVFDVKAVRDVTYYDGAEADKVKHQLDLFLPKEQKDFPVVMFIHGGAWRHGDKSFFGVYSALGSMFARNGIGAVVINYRLSPGVQHPEHIKDVARAFAWTHSNIEKYGGRPDQIFVSGHSAGGHLAALLATDESYLKAEGLSLKDIKGVMPMSGIYYLPDKLSISLTFAGPKQKVDMEATTSMVEMVFTSVFGKDKEERKKAFPLAHIREGLPPFLVVYADRDLPEFDKNAEDFAKALRAKDVKAETLEIAKRNHLSVVIDAAVDDDPTAVALRRFIEKQVKGAKNAEK